MEPTDAEKQTRDIMAHSRISLDNPDFMAMVMHRVEKENLSKINRHYYFKWIFIILILELCIGQVIGSSIGSISHWNTLPDAVLKNLEFGLLWVLDYQFFFLPFVVILIIKSILDAKMRFKSKFSD